MIQVAQEALSALKAVWRRRWLAMAAASVVAVVGMVVVWFVPNRYEATARIYVDTQTVLKPLMVGLAFEPDIDQQVRMLARTLVSRPNIERLLTLPGTNISGLAADHERAVDTLIERIKVDPSGGNLYVISIRDANPARAQAVVAGLVNIFVGAGVDDKQRDSQDASTFIDEQIKVYEAKLSESENRLKDFKIRNFGVSGVSNQDYYARTSTISDEVTRLKIALASAEQGRDAFKRELASEDPQLPQDSAAGMPAAPSDIDQRIEAQSKQLDELLRRYTEAHPDVVNARRVIAQLQAQKSAESKARAAGGHANGSAATSPVFQRIRVSLAEAEANVASLRSQLSAQQQRLDELRSTASKVPQAEAELAQLNRDYDVIRKNYDLLVARREAASLGVKMDKSAQLADFRVVEPPRVAPTPVFPDRRALALLAMLASIAVGLATAYALNMIAPTFDAARSLREFTKRPVLGTIGVYRTAQTLAAERQDLLRFGGAVAAFLVVQGIWIGLVASRFGHLS